MSKTLLKRSKLLKKQLLKRINELNLTWTDIAVDAQARGMKISVSTLSKYFNDSIATNLSDDGILWVSLRYGIDVSVFIGQPVADRDYTIGYHIPPYNEKKCLKAIKKAFPNNK